MEKDVRGTLRNEQASLREQIVSFHTFLRTRCTQRSQDSPPSPNAKSLFTPLHSIIFEYLCSLDIAFYRLQKIPSIQGLYLFNALSSAPNTFYMLKK